MKITHLTEAHTTRSWQVTDAILAYCAKNSTLLDWLSKIVNYKFNFGETKTLYSADIFNKRPEYFLNSVLGDFKQNIPALNHLWLHFGAATTDKAVERAAKAMINMLCLFATIDAMAKYIMDNGIGHYTLLDKSDILMTYNSREINLYLTDIKPKTKYFKTIIPELQIRLPDGNDLTTRMPDELLSSNVVIALFGPYGYDISDIKYSETKAVTEGKKFLNNQGQITTIETPIKNIVPTLRELLDEFDTKLLTATGELR